MGVENWRNYFTCCRNVSSRTLKLILCDFREVASPIPYIMFYILVVTMGKRPSHVVWRESCPTQLGKSSHASFFICFTPDTSENSPPLHNLPGKQLIVKIKLKHDLFNGELSSFLVSPRIDNALILS